MHLGQTIFNQLNLYMNHSLKPAVYIIGAGPGDPELLTLKAHRIITKADVILYAHSLVPKQILQDARSDAELIPTGKNICSNIIKPKFILCCNV